MGCGARRLEHDLAQRSSCDFRTGQMGAPKRANLAEAGRIWPKQVSHATQPHLPGASRRRPLPGAVLRAGGDAVSRTAPRGPPGNGWRARARDGARWRALARIGARAPAVARGARVPPWGRVRGVNDARSFTRIRLTTQETGRRFVQVAIGFLLPMRLGTWFPYVFSVDLTKVAWTGRGCGP